MEDFKWENKETYTNDDIKNILDQHKNVVYKQVKQEYEPKLKEYENQVNEYQEKELFNGLTEKQIKITKSLINTEYKELSKQEALTKIKTDYQEIFNIPNSTKNKIEKVEKVEQKEYNFNPKGLVQLHDLADKDNSTNLFEKAKTKGLNNRKDLEELIKLTFAEIR